MAVLRNRQSKLQDVLGDFHTLGAEVHCVAKMGDQIAKRLSFCKSLLYFLVILVLFILHPFIIVTNVFADLAQRTTMIPKRCQIQCGHGSLSWI